MKDCCSFFSAARRTNQEALPQLSGFSARRLGRRRGLRNSLRSDSPRPFSSVFLASSPPNKGGINQSFFRFYSTFFFLPLRPADTSPIFCVAKHPAMLRDTAGKDCDTKDFLSQPKKVLVTLIRFICSASAPIL